MINNKKSDFHAEMTEKYGEYKDFVYAQRDGISKKLIGGKGLNDVEFSVSCKNSGKVMVHPAYQTWFRMINNRDTNISSDWASLKSFCVYFKSVYRDGFCMNKDLIFASNTFYSKDTCAYVPVALTAWLYCHNRGGSVDLIGVTKCADGFIAKIKSGKKSKKIGIFNNEFHAHKAWQKHKKSQAIEWLNKGFPMQRIIDKLTNDIENNKITTSLID